LSSSARCSPPRTPPPRTGSVWARRAGRGTDRSARGLVDQAGPGCNSTRVASLLCL
jgi:hypothetical protein